MSRYRDPGDRDPGDRDRDPGDRDSGDRDPGDRDPGDRDRDPGDRDRDPGDRDRDPGDRDSGDRDPGDRDDFDDYGDYDAGGPYRMGGEGRRSASPTEGEYPGAYGGPDADRFGNGGYEPAPWASDEDDDVAYHQPEGDVPEEAIGSRRHGPSEGGDRSWLKEGRSWAVGGLDSSGRPVTRLAIIFVVVAMVALAAFADRSQSGSAAAASPEAATAGSAMPLSAPARAISTSWFCAGPVGSPAHLAAGSLVVANASARMLTGTVTFVPSSGTSFSQDVRVAAGASSTVTEPTVAANGFLGAIVNLDGGQAAVQQVISGTEGSSSTACATAGAGDWYFPAGTTQEASSLSMLLLNPFPGDAIADLSFTTNQGVEDPQDFQGVVVPGGGLVGLDLGSHLRDRSAVAATVHLRVGRVAAFETQIVQPQSAAQQQVAGAGAWPPGLDLTLGSPSPGTNWWWPTGADANAVTEEYVLYNPAGAVAQVSLGTALDQGSAEPFQVTVQPTSVSVITSNSESRIPMGVGHAAWVRSTNGVGVVAARLVMASSSATPPGITEVLGSRLEATGWLVPGDAAGRAENASVVVYNPGSSSASVVVTPFGSGGPRQVTIGPGRRYGLSLDGTDPVLVSGTAGAQLVVEGDTTAVHGVGLDSAIGVPLGS